MGTQYTETVCNGNTVLAIPHDLRRLQNIPMGNLQQLAAIRKGRGFTQATLAERVGVEQPTVQRWETGKREPDLTQLVRLAEILQVEPAALIDSSIAVSIGPRLYVKGDVAAGVWKPAFEAPQEEWQSFTGRSDVAAEMSHRFGLRVVGDSMNELYPEGTILECVSVFGHVEVEPGKRVIVVRQNIDGDCEATVKELVEQDGALWLVPRSTNPFHRPIPLADDPDPSVVETRVAAVVVSSVRPE